MCTLHIMSTFRKYSIVIIVIVIIVIIIVVILIQNSYHVYLALGELII